MSSANPRPNQPGFPRAALGTQQFINPKFISPDDDMVMLSGPGKMIRWLMVIFSIALMLLGISLIVDGVYGFGSSRVQGLFDLATNPMVGLMVGIVATAALQSSSTTTAITVTTVGVGAVSSTMAIPIILGANIGTTVTVFIVSFTYLGRREEFRRAFTSASLHFWFNLTMVALLIPLELLAQPLGRISGAIASSVFGGTLTPSVSGTLVTAIFQPIIDLIGTRGLIGELLPPVVAASACLLLGTAFIFLSVRGISAQLRILMATTTRTLLERTAGASDILGFLAGSLGTMALQASSVTVSSILPFAASGSLKPRESLSITIGANVGTTLTSLLVALALPGSLGTFALQAAIVHVLFNVFGAALVLVVPPYRNLILFLADRLARLAERSYTSTFLAITAIYLALPIAIIGLYSLFT